MHFRVVFEPEAIEVDVREGATLLEAAGQAGICLDTPCGGKGTCGKCLLELVPSGQVVRACQTIVEANMVVSVPSSSRLNGLKILEDGLDTAAQVRPTVIDTYRSVGSQGVILGVAVDIGTTTVVAKLLDMADGHCLGTEAMLNPQTRFGDDVISRISYGQTDAHLSVLNRAIVDCLNELILRLCQAAKVDRDAIYEVAVVGNTTMNHILLGFPIGQLGQAPYQAHSVEAHDMTPEEVGLRVNPAGNVHAAENIAGFVGADTTAVALAVEMDSVVDTTLVVDIGTNGELVLGAAGGLFAASCAAGPALEGARIEQGSRATDGAIEAVEVAGENELTLKVVGGKSPHSICGSGLIDAVAVLADLGLIDATGRLVAKQDAAGRFADTLVERLTEVDGQPAFCLAVGEGPSKPAVVLTQKDIREFQLAKGAILAGIRLLLAKVGIVEADLDRVLLAGAFGNYIRPSSAVRVGLLPKVPLERIHFVGNAAASGAQMLLLSVESRQRAKALSERIEYVEIAHEKTFPEVFAEAMFLGS